MRPTIRPGEWKRGEAEQDRRGDLEAARAAGDERGDRKDSDAEPDEHGDAGAEQEASVLPQDQHPGLQEPLRERAGGRDEPQGQVERGLRLCRRLEEALDETLAADLVLHLVEDVVRGRVALVPPILACGSRHCGDRTGGGAAQVPEAEVLRYPCDRARVDDPARDPALHDEIAFLFRQCSDAHPFLTSRLANSASMTLAAETPVASFAAFGGN